MLSRRSSAGVAVLEGALYVAGGNDGTSCLNSVERYSPKAGAWESVAPMNIRRCAGPHTCHHHSGLQPRPRQMCPRLSPLRGVCPHLLPRSLPPGPRPHCSKAPPPSCQGPASPAHFPLPSVPPPGYLPRPRPLRLLRWLPPQTRPCALLTPSLAPYLSLSALPAGAHTTWCPWMAGCTP